MAQDAIKRTFQTTIHRDGSMCFFEVPFDPKEVFGKVRAPVKVHLPKHTYRSTIAAMGGCICVPLRRSNREAAGLEGGEKLDVTLELDTDARDVELPDDLKEALVEAALLDGWNALSYSHKKEHADAIAEAKKPDTRERRIAAAVAMIGEKAKTKTKAAKAAPTAAKRATKAKPKAKAMAKTEPKAKAKKAKKR